MAKDSKVAILPKKRVKVDTSHRRISNRVHEATVFNSHVQLRNKTTQDEIDLIYDSKDKLECLLDVIFNRD